MHHQHLTVKTMSTNLIFFSSKMFFEEAQVSKHGGSSKENQTDKEDIKRVIIKKCEMMKLIQNFKKYD